MRPIPPVPRLRSPADLPLMDAWAIAVMGIYEQGRAIIEASMRCEDQARKDGVIR